MKNDLKKMLSSLLLVLCFIQNTSCQNKALKNQLLGEWSYEGEKKLFSLNPYYDRRVEIVNNDRLIFHEDYLEIASGIYFLTNQEWPKGNYPWIYCGNNTHYELSKNELSIYNPGTKSWKTFSVQMVKNDSIILSTESEMHSLTRKKNRLVNNNNNINSIHLRVLDVDPFLIDFEVHLENNKIKVIYDSTNQEATSKNYADYILKGFDKVVLSDIREIYVSETSENRILELDIEYNGGKKKHSKIIGRDYPDELKLALLPLIYAGDFINHKEYWAGIIK